MILFPYTGGWTRINPAPRNPELLTKLAPQEYQTACVAAGGRNWYGEPNFRLVILRSRFQHCGGFDFESIQESEALLPRYEEVPAYPDCFVLEVWKPPSWYDEQGFGSQEHIEWSTTGKSIHKLEPIPARGGYEAVTWEASIPLYFPVRPTLITWQGKPTIQHRVTTDEVKQAILAYRMRQDIETSELLEQREFEQRVKENQDEIEYAERVAEKLTIFDGMPGTSMCGAKPIYK